MSLLRQYRENENGVAAIEGALVFPFLLVTGFGIIDASLLMMQHHRLSAGLTSAGSYLAKSPNPQSLEANAKQLAISGSFQSNKKPYIKNLQPNVVSISYRNIANPEINGARDYRGGDTVKVVEIKTNIPYMGLGFLKTLSRGNLKISVQHETRLVG